MMKVIHVPFCFYPDPVGGTEVYVDAIAREQQREGCEVLIAAPGERDESYWHQGLPVRRFGGGAVTDIRRMYGEGDLAAAQAFGRILDDARPELVHLHAFTRCISLRLVREVKRRGIPVVFSYHTPTASCQRGTLLRWGEDVCDGTLDVHGCAQCTLHGHGLNKTVSVAFGSLPASVGRFLGNAGASGGIFTALRMTELMELRHSSFRALMSEVDHVIALCDWVKDVVLRNGVASDKITVSRQGLCHEWIPVRTPAAEVSGLRVAFLGRMEPIKGVHLLIEALAAIPTAAIRLGIYGVIQGPGEYAKRLRRKAAGDKRIVFHEPVPASEVTTVLRDYDVLAVPSQWLETGPMVVLEAFAAGIPVVGSRLGGIAELVRDGVNGLLVDGASPEAWGRVLEKLSIDRGLLAQLRSGVRPPRRIRESAMEVLALYSKSVRPPVCLC